MTDVEKGVQALLQALLAFKLRKIRLEAMVAGGQAVGVDGSSECSSLLNSVADNSIPVLTFGNEL